MVWAVTWSWWLRGKVISVMVLQDYKWSRVNEGRCCRDRLPPSNAHWCWFGMVSVGVREVVAESLLAAGTDGGVEMRVWEAASRVPAAAS
ncbi:hypothetical protein E2C01_061960 [Portunus trituberculatus]|uniref:Uncharacterized protein n=1 Tax=Portunus trituberculatus TaxID=210409 RepID=A0A5B7HCS5_PORTR|nr:hypothetical protein [Portunus trituberculatus]